MLSDLVKEILKICLDTLGLFKLKQLCHRNLFDMDALAFSIRILSVGQSHLKQLKHFLHTLKQRVVNFEDSAALSDCMYFSISIFYNPEIT